MSRPLIEVNGLLVDQRDKKSLLKTIDTMISLSADQIKSNSITKESKREVELATVSFFGSIKHYLQGGSEV